MSKATDSHTDPIRRLAQLISDTVTEDIRAHRVITSLLWTPDHYVLRRPAVPGTYAEFLLRTSGPLRHEPPASARAYRWR
jgi:hypothetical protein